MLDPYRGDRGGTALNQRYALHMHCLYEYEAGLAISASSFHVTTIVHKLQASKSLPCIQHGCLAWDLLHLLQHYELLVLT